MYAHLIICGQMILRWEGKISRCAQNLLRFLRRLFRLRSQPKASECSILYNVSYQKGKALLKREIRAPTL
jgi:hypothetical protein